MTLRVGLAGTGEWASSVYGEALSSSPGYSFSGIWGRNVVTRDALSWRCRVRSFETFEALVEDNDVVVFALPPSVQVDLAPVAAAHGTHMLLEKPIALDVGAARSAVEQVIEAGVAASVFLTRLFDPGHRLWLDDQRGRHPNHGAVKWQADSFVPGSRWMGGWRKTSDEFADVGPHVIAQLEWVLGPITEVEVLSRGRGGGVDVAFMHRSGATSTALVNLHRPIAPAREFYRFDGPVGSYAREADIDPITAARAALGDLRSQIVDETRIVDQPWGLERSLAALEIVAQVTAVDSAA